MSFSIITTYHYFDAGTKNLLLNKNSYIGSLSRLTFLPKHKHQSLTLFFSPMESKKKQVSLELLPWLVVHTDGTIERLAGTEVCPPGLDPETGVFSKDIIIEPKTGLSARIYRPFSIQTDHKLPLVLYFHGGAFLISSASFPCYHTSLNKFVNQANVIAVSVNYR